jgi:hypothetical protein
LTPGARIRYGKISKSGSGSGINDPDHISESCRDPGWKNFGSGIRDKHPGSATLLNNFKS